jgi:hypothetical protein
MVLKGIKRGQAINACLSPFYLCLCTSTPPCGFKEIRYAEVLAKDFKQPPKKKPGLEIPRPGFKGVKLFYADIAIRACAAMKPVNSAKRASRPPSFSTDTK